MPGLLGRWLRAIGRIFLFAVLFIGLLSAGSLLGQRLDGGEHITALIGSALMAVAALAAGALLIRRLDHRPAGALGLAWTNRSAREIGVGLAIGVGALVIAAIAMAAAGGLRYTGQGGDVLGWTRIVAAGFGGLAVAAFAEEVLFRGYPFQVLAQVAGGAAATLALSLLFALAHAGNPNVDTFALVNIFLAGVLLSVAYLRTRSLWFATAVHLGWNWAMALLFDLLAIAWQADLTRVASFMMGRDVTYQSYPEIGITEGHHPLSHHGNNPEKMARFGAINTYETQFFAKFLERLRSTRDGEGTLLDNSIVFFGSGMSGGNTHSTTGLPIVIAGGGGGHVKGGRHLRHPVSPSDGIPLGNVLLSIGQRMGVEMEQHGQSTGTIDL